MSLAPARSLVKLAVDGLVDSARRCRTRVVSKSQLYLHESSLVTSSRHPSTRAIGYLVSAIPAGASTQLAADGSGPGLEWMPKTANLMEG